jgi:hypothetical protein
MCAICLPFIEHYDFFTVHLLGIYTNISSNLYYCVNTYDSYKQNTELLGMVRYE